MQHLKANSQNEIYENKSEDVSLSKLKLPVVQICAVKKYENTRT